MIEQTGKSYMNARYAKGLFASDNKVGKSCFLVGSALGLLPWQKNGGVVDKPANLHVITFDSNALGGVNLFLTKTCGAPPEALDYRVYNCQDEARRVSDSQEEYDFGLFNTLVGVIDTVSNRAAQANGVSALLISSLTGLAGAMERSVFGPPSKNKGQADISKWGKFAQLLSDLRNLAQLDNWHCFWEAHLYRPKSITQGKGEGQAPQPETIQVSGKTGANFGYNVEQIFRIRRQFNQPAPGTKCDMMYMDTQPSLDFVANGRSFKECLDPKEYDLTLALHKLGLRVGRWGMKAPLAKAASGR